MNLSDVIAKCFELISYKTNWDILSCLFNIVSQFVILQYIIKIIMKCARAKTMQISFPFKIPSIKLILECKHPKKKETNTLQY